MSVFYNNKGVCSLVLLALVNAEYRFLWVDVGSSGSLSDAQIFNYCKVKKKTDNCTCRLTAEPPGGGRACFVLFLLGNHTFTLRPWLVKPYSRRQLISEERITNYRIFK